MWIFEIKDDGTFKSRLVGRGDMMKVGVHYDDGDTYCGNVNPSSIRLVLKIAAMYGLLMIGGDIDGAYLITRTKQPIAIHTPQGWYCPPGMVYMVHGNLYGLSTAGNTFSISFDECVAEAGFISSPWDPKCFWKWHHDDGVPTLLMAHSDDFRCFYSESHKDEYDKLNTILISRGYKIKITTDKPFVGIEITRDEHGNYYMSQSFFKKQIINLAGLGNVTTPAQLPHVCNQPPLTQLDGLSYVQSALSAQEVADVKAFPYRTLVGSLQYVQVHTGIPTMYSVNVLSRYCNDHGPRHITALKQVILYLIGTVDDRIIFRRLPMSATVPKAIPELQLSVYVDAELGGQDERHSQECHIVLLGGDVIAFASHRQSTISTGTMESEIKAACNVSKTEICSTRKLLDAMGIIQEPTKIYEDNSAVVTVSKQAHLAKGMRHLGLWLTWIQELVKDKIVELIKVKTTENLADIGTKYLDKQTFQSLERRLMDKELTKLKFPKFFK
jgi:hypothetical protein